MKIRHLSLIALLIIMSSLLLGGCSLREQIEEEEDYENIIENAVDYFVITEAYSREQSEMEYWYEPKQQAMLKEMEGSFSSEIKFINAYLAQYENRNTDALELFEECIATANPRTQADMIAKCYFELARNSAYNGEPGIARYYAGKMTEAFNGEGDKSILVYLDVYLALEMIECKDGNELALELVLAANKLAEQINFDNMQYVTFYVAYVYSYLGSIQIAYNYYIDSLSYATAAGETYWVGLINSDIGSNYFTEGDYNNAIKYLEMAEETFVNLNAKEDNAYIYDEIYVTDTLFLAHIQSKDSVSAYKYLAREKELIDRAPDGKAKNDNLAKYYTSVAESFLYKNYYYDAIVYLNKADDLYEADEYFYFVDFDVLLYSLYGKAYRGLDNRKLAINYYEKAIKKYEERNQNPDYEILNSLYDLYREWGKKEETLEYADKLITSLYNLSKDNKQRDAEYLLEAFQTTKKEAEIGNLKYRNYILNIVFISCVIFAGITSYLGIISYQKNKTIKKLNEKLVKASRIDELTQLNNRRSLNNYFENDWESIFDEHKNVSIVMLDVDFFKLYNDYYGHVEGDNVLADISLSISENIGDSDFAARYGGEEFLIILPDADREKAIAVMQNVQNSIMLLGITHVKSSVSDRVTISVGIATSDKSVDYMTMIRMADEALYKAKEKRNTIVSVECE